MKPTISNAFNNESAQPENIKPEDSSSPPSSWELRKPQDTPAAAAPNAASSPRNPRKSLAASLASMQVDLREAAFGFSLELSPMQAVDALQALLNPEQEPGPSENMQYLVSMEQSAWLDNASTGETASISDIAQRLAIGVLEQFGPDHLVMDALSLKQLVSLCQPTRLMVVAVDGMIDQRDVSAIERGIGNAVSPLLTELRAAWALEVIDDRSIVLHCREREPALLLVAENFRHYLAALNGRPAKQFAPPENWQVDRLLSLTGALSVRPIETQMFSTSIDVGINTSKEHLIQPADRSLIYDIPSNTWHDEP